MSVDMTAERLAERGRAMLAWQAAGGRVDRLARLDRAVARSGTTDWPGRRPGPELRTGLPDLDLDGWRRGGPWG